MPQTYITKLSTDKVFPVYFLSTGYENSFFPTHSIIKKMTFFVFSVDLHVVLLLLCMTRLRIPVSLLELISLR